MTRYARALRDVALASGERPARRGYPASVFDNLPRLLERPGRPARTALLPLYGTAGKRGRGGPDGG